MGRTPIPESLLGRENLVNQGIRLLLVRLLPGLRQVVIFGYDFVAVVGLAGSGVGAYPPAATGGIQVLDRRPVVGQLRRGPVALELPGVAVYARHSAHRCQVLHAEMVIRAVGVHTDDVVPRHVGSILLPDLDQFVRIPFLDLQPFLLRVFRGRRRQLFVLHHVLSRRRIGRIGQAVAANRGRVVLEGRPHAQLHVLALPGDVIRVGIRLHPQPLTLVDVREELLRVVLGSLMNGEGVPHQAAERLLYHFHTLGQYRVNVLPANEIETDLMRGHAGADHELVGLDLTPVHQLDAGGRTVLDDDLVHLGVGVELAAQLGQYLVAGVGYLVSAARAETDEREVRRKPHGGGTVQSIIDVIYRGDGESKNTGLQFRAFKPFLDHVLAAGGKD